MAAAARAAGIHIVTGDTKVVERGKGDGIYINTAGVGIVLHGLEISPSSVRPGDSVLLSGDLGRHGMTIMSLRAGGLLETAWKVIPLRCMNPWPPSFVPVFPCIACVT